MPASMKRRALRGTMPSHSRWGSPCTWQRKPSSAYFSARTMPDLASRSEATTSWVLFPMEETIPIPVTTTRRIATPSPCLLPAAPPRMRPGANPGAPLWRPGAVSCGCGLFTTLEQSDAKVGGGVDYLSVRLHDPVGNRQFQLAQDHTFQIDHVLHGPGRGNDHAGKFHLADAERAAFARGAEPAEEEARQLPQRIESQAAGHDWVALEVAGPQPFEHGI